MSTRFSVVVPVYNERVVLPRLLAFARRWEQACHEVVFSDGGSVDGTPELLRRDDRGQGFQGARRAVRPGRAGQQRGRRDASLDADVAVAPTP